MDTYIVEWLEPGRRRGELLHLEWEDVDLVKRCLLIKPATTKTKRAKLAFFGELREEHLRRMAEHGTDGRVFQFPHCFEELHRCLAAIQKAARMDPQRADVMFRAFRRTVGNEITRRYGIHAAQHKLGHSDLMITEEYYSQEATREPLEKAVAPSPPGKVGNNRTKASNALTMQPPYPIRRPMPHTASRRDPSPMPRPETAPARAGARLRPGCGRSLFRAIIKAPLSRTARTSVFPRETTGLHRCDTALAARRKGKLARGPSSRKAIWMHESSRSVWCRRLGPQDGASTLRKRTP
ncbi:MAG: tyrosine-type recombinase/integrase [Pirellulales bacterium]|nr:tyrosine-type recombinase/integrase [Pirellulales bacterium]